MLPCRNAHPTLIFADASQATEATLHQRHGFPATPSANTEQARTSTSAETQRTLRTTHRRRLMALRPLAIASSANMLLYHRSRSPSAPVQPSLRARPTRTLRYACEARSPWPGCLFGRRVRRRGLWVRPIWGCSPSAHHDLAHATAMASCLSRCSCYSTYWLPCAKFCSVVWGRRRCERRSPCGELASAPVDRLRVVVCPNDSVFSKFSTGHLCVVYVMRYLSSQAIGANGESLR
ncbi:uncharacterized protein C8Q71DRAFT_495007 [Rhodofomes roseus]|uniref:Uncharacterized protein n=1 Tax=Rhodofomes roseus TaxID=34475 RepID=A0ABQ8KL91_9APHY|nr:uncharacterized protein C8Q71DRAFT_495007 [Rhodofomes roseus]KAH9839089.1 hypothetical protein C8Q71DRAFT_495007 [Rhodofomes roseus]